MRWDLVGLTIRNATPHRRLHVESETFYSAIRDLILWAGAAVAAVVAFNVLFGG